MPQAPEKHIFRGVLFTDQHPAGIAGRFEAYDAQKELYFVKTRFQPIFIPDQGEPFKVVTDWRFEAAK